jgi:hypothetical protein
MSRRHETECLYEPAGAVLTFNAAIFCRRLTRLNVTILGVSHLEAVAPFLELAHPSIVCTFTPNLVFTPANSTCTFLSHLKHGLTRC